MIALRRILLVAFIIVPFLLLISLSIVYNSLNRQANTEVPLDSSQYESELYQSAASEQLIQTLQSEIVRLRKRIVELEKKSSHVYNGNLSKRPSALSTAIAFSSSSTQPKIARKSTTHNNNEPTFGNVVSSEKLVKRRKKSILITGGAGFVGSHLLDRLIGDGHRVIVVDNFYTGHKRNIEHWIGHPSFQLLEHDVVNPLYLENIDQIYHLASPASPPHYMRNAVKTIKINSIGTLNMLGLAKRLRARILVASTSEVYGDPEVHPQSESYWGNVNPIGPRSCYDEGKRVAESLTYAYAKQSNLDVRVARIFNTYGPRMHAQDGRVVSNFISQALQNQPLTVYGGNQTRSFQYISDLVSGLIALMESDYTLPVNIGNPEEYSINELAAMILELVHNDKDDPRRRRPDITLAKEKLNWSPRVSALDGLKKTVEYFRDELRNNPGFQLKN